MVDDMAADMVADKVADMVADMVHSAQCAQVMHIAATKISVERSAQGRKSRVHLA